MQSVASRRKPARVWSGLESSTLVRARQVLLVVVSLTIAILWLAPALWAISTSLKTTPDLIRPIPYWIPQPFTLSNYVAVFSSTRAGTILRPVVNSVVVAVLTTVFTVFVSALTAYPLA